METRILPELQDELYNELMDNNFTGCEVIINDCFNKRFGENARRMLEIGMIQDELVKLGFRFMKYSQQNESYIYVMIDDRMGKKRLDIEIFFRLNSVSIDAVGYEGSFLYTSSTWQQDLLDKVKELINEN